VQLVGHRTRHLAERRATERELQLTQAYLAIAPKIDEALEKLSQKLFDELVGMLEEKLTIALQEVLEQAIELRAAPEFLRGSASDGLASSGDNVSSWTWKTTTTIRAPRTFGQHGFWRYQPVWLPLTCRTTRRLEYASVEYY
jgi:hypothetical protein